MGIGDGTPTNPPWHSHALFGSKSREESGSWWKELGQSVPAYRKNQRSHAGEVRENDIDWYDPPVKDGESLANVHGLDTKTHPDGSKKVYQPGNLYDFQKKIMKDSVQYKQMRKKHEISEEHPGIAVSPSLKTLQHLEPHTLGKTGPFNNNFYHFGPRFWDKPIGEGSIGLTVVQLRAFPEFPYHRTYNSRQVMRRYLSNLPLPCALAFTYGSGLCASAQIRHVDDWWNFVAASALSGSLLSAVRGNVVPGVVFGLVTSSLAYFYQHIRSSNAGFGRSTPQETGGPPIATVPLRGSTIIKEVGPRYQNAPTIRNIESMKFLRVINDLQLIVLKAQ
uniref:Uncharacterized protein n=1 Tax=Ditylenchus dipsaci TaxID=166011 RepID=A0A915EE08_9BILA